MTVSTVCCSRFGSGSMVVSPITQCFIKLCVETALQKLRYRFLEQPLDISSIPVTFALLSSSRISSRLASSSGVLFLPISFSSILSLLLYTIHGVYTRFGMVSDNHTVLWYTVLTRFNKRLYRATNLVAGLHCHGSSRPGNKCVVITILLNNPKRLPWYLQFIGSSTIPLKFHVNAITKRNSGNSERLWETARKHLDSIGWQRQWATG